MSANLSEYLKQVEQLEKQKQGIIEKLLADRAAIDEQLQKLGYNGASRGGRKGGRPKGSKDTTKRAAKQSKGE